MSVLDKGEHGNWGWNKTVPEPSKFVLTFGGRGSLWSEANRLPRIFDMKWISAITVNQLRVCKLIISIDQPFVRYLWHSLTVDTVVLTFHPWRFLCDKNHDILEACTILSATQSLRCTQYRQLKNCSFIVQHPEFYYGVSCPEDSSL